MEQNVTQFERIASLALAAVAVQSGAKKRGFGGLLAVAAGGFLAKRALTGHCNVYEAMGRKNLDTAADEANHSEAKWSEDGLRFQRAISIERSTDDILRFLRHGRALAAVVKYIPELEYDEESSSFLVNLPLGKVIHVVFQEEEGVHATTEVRFGSGGAGSSLQHSGVVRVSELDAGISSMIEVELHVQQSPNQIENTLVKTMLPVIDKILKEGLKHIKNKLETGSFKKRAGAKKEAASMQTEVEEVVEAAKGDEAEPVIPDFVPPQARPNAASVSPMI